ncbi:hypothetical protein ACS0TY_035258 [Phlomoides rotata]
MANLWFPDSIVMKAMSLSTGGYAYYMDESDAVRGFVRCAEATAFSPFSAIEVERSEVDDRFVHLRFRHTNKYWGRQVGQQWIVATSNQPIEDRSKPECTLFEPSMATGTGRLLLQHVQSGGRVALNTVETGNLSARLYCFNGAISGISFDLLLFDFLNSQTLLKLPRRVALKGDNGMFLRAATQTQTAFASNDPNERESAFEIELNDDGRIRIKSTNLDRYLRRAPTNLILGDTTVNTGNDTLFWPIHVRGSTYALRSAGNNNFCRRFTSNALSASTTTMTNVAQIEIQELVIERHIYHIRFRMDQLRIFDELPFVAGVGTSVNNSDEESTLTVKVSYEDTRSFSFTNGESETSGKSMGFTITTGFPRIIEFGLGVETSSENTVSFQWGEVVEETTKAEASVRVPVPAKSRARVDFVGTQGTCSIPFTYTQRDRSSSDGSFVANSNIDGLYEGVNYHSFHFEHYVIEPLAEDEIIQ